MKWLGSFALGWLPIGCLWLGVSIADREAPIVYESARTLSTSGSRGGLIEVEFVVNRLRLCPTQKVNRYIIDSTGERTQVPSATTTPRQRLGLDTYRRKVVPPPQIALGPAAYQVEIFFECNVIHRLGYPIVVLSPKAEFEVFAANYSLPLPDMGVDGE